MVIATSDTIEPVIIGEEAEHALLIKTNETLPMIILESPELEANDE